MNNGKHNDNGTDARSERRAKLVWTMPNEKEEGEAKQKLSRLSNLHIIWVCAKRLTLVGLLVVMVWAVMNSGAGIFLTAALGFLIIPSLIRLAVRVVVTLVYIALLMLILSLIIL